MQRLARAATGAMDEVNANRLVARSGGNPLFLEQLVLNAGDADAKPLPGTIRALVQARLDRLSPGDRSALQACQCARSAPRPAGVPAPVRPPHFDPAPLVAVGLLAFDGTMMRPPMPRC